MRTQSVSSRPARGELISLATAAKLLSVNPHTLFRWHKYGMQGATLRTRFVGGRLFTTEAWLNEFLDAVDAARQANKGRRQKRSARQRQAKRVLDNARV